jgi:excisionase family DNA binding protein
MAGRETRRRATVQEAADELGVSVDAVRKRIQRGALESTKEGQRVYVWLDEILDFDQSKRQVEGGAVHEQMRERIEDLKHQLEEEREARRRADTIIAQLSQTASEQARTIRQLEAPSRVAEQPQEPPERGDEGSTPTESRTEQERGAQRPWWRRIFGG